MREKMMGKLRVKTKIAALVFLKKQKPVVATEVLFKKFQKQKKTTEPEHNGSDIRGRKLNCLIQHGLSNIIKI